jgi:putative (di)nucleoside polyphosphate hydrolase
MVDRTSKSASSRNDSPTEQRPQTRANRTKARGRPQKQSDPDLVALLAEPDVRLLMRADGVDEQEFLRMVKEISIKIRANSGADGDRAQPHSGAINATQYRSGVGIILLNQKSEIFVGRRNDLLEDAWQMPQGGIDDGENPRQAALRELKEETGVDDVDVLSESERWLYYDLPGELAEKAWGGRWKGQRQKWFVMLFKGVDADVNIDVENPEFNAWRWVSVHELTDLAASFKRQLYTDIIGEFATIFRD